MKKTFWPLRQRLWIIALLIVLFGASTFLVLQHKQYIIRSWILSITSDLWFDDHRDELRQLLGAERDHTYLIALMNAAEAKPDGGFFGSYVELTIWPKKFEYEFFDSYYPYSVKPIALTVTWWYEQIFDTNKLHFLGVNNFWFTDLDGKYLLKLYHQTFVEQNKKVDGVLFINDKLFSVLIDNYNQLKRQRQFFNATVDIYDPDRQWSPKQRFFASARDQLSWLWLVDLAWRARTNIDYLIKQWYIRLYLPDISDTLFDDLRNSDLMNIYDDNNVYVYEYNIWFNKIDQFVTKQITLLQSGHIVMQTTDDIMSTLERESWKYELQITYEIDVPDEYQQYIQQLTNEYNKELTQREEIILMLQPQRHTQTIISLPAWVTVRDVKWDAYTDKQFSLWFADAVIYRSVEKGHNVRSNTVLEIIIP